MLIRCIDSHPHPQKKLLLHHLLKHLPPKHLPLKHLPPKHLPLKHLQPKPRLKLPPPTRL
jgi:hypothetical protein